MYFDPTCTVSGESTPVAWPATQCAQVSLSDLAHGLVALVVVVVIVISYQEEHREMVTALAAHVSQNRPELIAPIFVFSSSSDHFTQRDGKADWHQPSRALFAVQFCSELDPARISPFLPDLSTSAIIRRRTVLYRPGRRRRLLPPHTGTAHVHNDLLVAALSELACRQC